MSFFTMNNVKFVKFVKFVKWGNMQHYYQWLLHVSAGLGSFVVLNLLPPTHNMFSKMRNNFGCCVKRKTVTAIAVGGTLLGVGMALSGAVSTS